MLRYMGSLMLGLLFTLSVFVIMQNFVVNRQFQTAIAGADAGATSVINLGNQNLLASRSPQQLDKPSAFRAPPLPEELALTAVDAPEVPAPAMNMPAFKPVFVTGAVENLGTQETANAEPVPATQTPAEQQTVIASGDLVLVDRIEPKYPPQAIRAGIESGSVTVKFTVQPDGSVTNPVVTDAKPRRDVFDQAALRAISHWKFKPIAAAKDSTITLDFNLAGGG